MFLKYNNKGKIIQMLKKNIQKNVIFKIILN